MQTAKRRQTQWAIMASLTAHVAVGIFLLLQHPTLSVPVSEPGPPEPVIPVLLMPKTPPEEAGKLAQPEPIRLHRRPQPFLPPEAPTAPIAPPTPAAAAPPAPHPAPPALHPAPQPEGPKGDVRTALRQGSVGCANPMLVGLNRSERDLCDEKLGKGAKNAPFVGLGLTAEKQRLLDAAGARKEADYRYKYGPEPGPVPDTNPPGESAEAMKKALGVDGHSLTIPY
jgi:hypothetical protein